MIVVSTKPFGAATKYPEFLVVGALNVFFRRANCLNINSAATERHPETPAILQNLIEARKFPSVLMACKSGDADTHGVIGRAIFLTHLLHIRHAIYTDVRLSYSCCTPPQVQFLNGTYVPVVQQPGYSLSIYMGLPYKPVRPIVYF